MKRKEALELLDSLPDFSDGCMVVPTMEIFKEDLRDICEGGLLEVPTLASGIEVKVAWPDFIYEVHKYASGVYGIPVTKANKPFVLRLASGTPKARFRELLIDHGFKPYVTLG